MAFHLDSAPAHAADFTHTWMKDHKVKWIPKEHWFINSTDIASMNFAVNGIFEKILKKRQTYSVGELVCVAKPE